MIDYACFLGTDCVGIYYLELFSSQVVFLYTSYIYICRAFVRICIYIYMYIHKFVFLSLCLFYLVLSAAICTGAYLR